MLTGDAVCLRAGGKFHIGRLRNLLPDGYQLSEEHAAEWCGQMLDTYDGHLRCIGHILLQLKGELALFDLSSGEIHTQPVKIYWTMAGELRGGAVGFKLKELSELRAFLPVCELTVSLHRLAVLDEVEKIVVRARVITVQKGRKSHSWLVTEPLRGYSTEHKHVLEALSEYGCAAISAEKDFYPQLAINRPLYESKPEVPLVQSAPIIESTSRIAQAFLDVARSNEAGIMGDQDTEFVHDYRVSLRRVRSLLSLFKGVYSAEDTARLKSELAMIMKQTNRLRDLDVYLMDRAGYYKLVPKSMHGGLDIMFDQFVEERKTVFGEVCRMLRSKAYADQIKAVQGCFSQAGLLRPGSAAEESTGHFARRLILKRYTKVSRIASMISPETPDEQVHELRIQCKKLRYLLEFFVPLFPAKIMKGLVKPLKRLQDVLGRFNDYSVQQASLSAFVERHPMRGKKGLMLAESIGALVATLYQLQLKARSEVESCIEGFVNDDTKKQFERLKAK
jgi:CHAD domain-containing protein